MTAVYSSTFDHKYFYFIPIVTYGWYKLGVNNVCFIPEVSNEIQAKQFNLVHNYSLGLNTWEYKSPKHKAATYAQCLRNYAACLKLPLDERLCISDVDMLLFKIPEYINNDKMSVFGSDLVPDGQYPECYITGQVFQWRNAFNLHGKTYQQAIDDLLGADECEHYRGCRWSVDQEQSFLKISPTEPNLIKRARPGTQFAIHRVDREDINWRSYVNDDLVDAHLWRDGFEESNFKNIMELLQMKYPNDNFDWLVEYTEAYKKLL